MSVIICGCRGTVLFGQLERWKQVGLLGGRAAAIDSPTSSPMCSLQSDNCCFVVSMIIPSCCVFVITCDCRYTVSDCVIQSACMWEGGGIVSGGPPAFDTPVSSPRVAGSVAEVIVTCMACVRQVG